MEKITKSWKSQSSAPYSQVFGIETNLSSIELQENNPAHLSLVPKNKIKDIQILQRLGGGKFGDVFKGMWQVNYNISLLCKINNLFIMIIQGTTEVALKILKTGESNKEFEKESKLLMYVICKIL